MVDTRGREAQGGREAERDRESEIPLSVCPSRLRVQLGNLNGRIKCEALISVDRSGVLFFAASPWKGEGETSNSKSSSQLRGTKSAVSAMLFM